MTTVNFSHCRRGDVFTFFIIGYDALFRFLSLSTVKMGIGGRGAKVSESEHVVDGEQAGVLGGVLCGEDGSEGESLS